LKLTLPYPPSSNHYKRHYCSRVQRHPVRAYITSVAQAFINEVAKRVEEEGIQPLQGRLRVTLHVYQPNRRFDLESSLKVLLDALAVKKDKKGNLLRGGCYLNDRQIREMHLFQEIDAKDPRVEVTVEEVLDA
jgi:Holliday junction resolvase RusA-like endonuclease